MGIDPAGRRAVLAGIVVAEGFQPLDRPGDIGIAIDQDRGIAAELEVDPLELLGGPLCCLLRRSVISEIAGFKLQKG